MFWSKKKEDSEQGERERSSFLRKQPVMARATSIDYTNHVITEDNQYLIYDPETGENQLDNSKPLFMGNKFYRKIQNTHEKGKSGFLKKQMFVDDEYPIKQYADELRDLHPEGGPCILKRLIHLYPKNYKFSFFPSDGQVGSKYNEDSGTVHSKKYSINSRKTEFFLGEVNLFDPEHYKSFFITQDFDPEGRYLLAVNYEGRYHTQVVDDYIPVYENTLEPVWTRDLQNPWLNILIKMWAKLKGGYENLKNCNPMDFLRTFSNSNWRYYNLTKQAGLLSRYLDSTEAKIVVKSKNNNEVISQGLAPNELAYQILDIARINEKQKQSKINKEQNLLVLMRSTLPCQWRGQYSFPDKKSRGKDKLFTDRRMGLTLQRTFIVNHKDFYNLFASCYVTSLRKHAVSDYYLIRVPPNTKNAIHLGFTTKKNGFIDFSFQQPQQNKRMPTASSHIEVQKERKAQGSHLREDQIERYQKCKYILIRRMEEKDYSSDSEREDENQGFSVYSNKSRFEQYRERFEEQFEPLDYYAVDLEYLKGYNQGEGHFINLDKGNYIFRFRPETSDKQTFYVLNYTSNQYIKMRELKIGQEQRGEILRQSMTSLINQMSYISLDKKLELEKIVLANEAEDIGYSFVAVASNKKNKKLIKINIDPELVRQSGYNLKNPFKANQEPFAVMVEPGKSSGVVLKKIPNFGTYYWPPRGIDIMKK